MTGEKCRVVEFVANMADGGAQALIRDYANLIDKEKFEMYIVTIHPSTDSANYSLAIQGGAQIISIYKRYGIFERICNKIQGKRYVSNKLLRIIKEIKPDTIHIHLDVLRYLESIQSELKGIKLLYTCHNKPVIFFSGYNESERIIAKQLIKNNGLLLIALHEDMRCELNKMFGVNNTVVIKNGIDIQKFQNVRESKAEIRKSLGINEDAYVVGHVGRFSTEKNHEYLLKIFMEIVKSKSNAHLMLVGDGPKLPVIKDIISQACLSEKCTILSHRTDVPCLMKAMDAFVFPSIHEGLPVSVVEAQAAGLKCVISDTITKECMITPNVTSMSINDNPAKWAEKLLDNSWKGEAKDNLKFFDMKEEMKRLENLYLNEK